MASNSIVFPFEKLRGRENFDIWKRHAKSCMVIKGCWKIIEKGLPDEPKPNDVELNERALAEITLMIDPSNFGHIATAETAKSAWDSLMSAYEDNGLTRKVELLKQLVGLKLTDFDSIQDYVNAMVMTSLKVENAGLNIDEELTASLMLAGLPDEFRALVLAVENSKTKLTIDVVKNLLLQDVKFDSKNSESALFTKNKNKKQFRCHTCKKIGHFAKSCPNKRQKPRDFNCEKVLIASLYANNNDSNDWYIDSGASAHMTNNVKILKNKTEVNGKEVIVANNNKVSVKSSGDVEMTLVTRNKKTNVTVKNVEFVPGLCANLLSVRKLTENGNKVIFENEQCKIYDNKSNLIGIATVYNDLYRLNCFSKNSIEKAMTVQNSMKLWHRRMGHICSENLKNSLSALNIKNKISGNITDCVVCLKGKQTRASFKDIGHRAKNVLDLIHSDVVGPLETKSFGGAQYILTFVDDFTRKTFVIPICKKSEVFSEFVNFKKMVENQCSRTIKVLRSDNGTEYINEQFKNFLKSNGILHQRTSPYTPEQNGVAERMNRTLMERVRCMLIDSQLSSKFWAEAASTAAYIINLVPCRGSHLSPHELWTNQSPDLKYLRVFGCKAMVHVPKIKRTKLEPKSIECIFVGYDSQSKAYRLFNPATNKIMVSRHVVCFENESLVMNSNGEKMVKFIACPRAEVVDSGEENGPPDPCEESPTEGDGETANSTLSADDVPIVRVIVPEDDSLRSERIEQKKWTSCSI